MFAISGLHSNNIYLFINGTNILRFTVPPCFLSKSQCTYAVSPEKWKPSLHFPLSKKKTTATTNMKRNEDKKTKWKGESSEEEWTGKNFTFLNNNNNLHNRGFTQDEEKLEEYHLKAYHTCLLNIYIIHTFPVTIIIHSPTFSHASGLCSFPW